eukprot:scaffold10056_cov164-Amphora_coffeaeformis.AAC.6
MDSNLQAIMARRRQLAEGKAEAAAEKKKAETPAPAPAPPPKGDKLQEIMARRRRLADGGGDAGSVDKKEESSTEMTVEDLHKGDEDAQKGDNLQEIMARRRRLADGAGDAGSGGDNKQEAEMTMEDLQKHHPRHTVGLHSSRNSSLGGSASFEHNAHSSMGDNLQSIMERRRRLADGEQPPPPPPAPPATTNAVSPPHSPPARARSSFQISHMQALPTYSSPVRAKSSFQISPMQTLPAQRRGSASALAYTPQGLNSPTRAVAHVGSSDTRLAPGEKPSVVASPVKSDLKGFSMSQDLKAIMDRRRKIASGEITDDEDPPMVQDEDPPEPVMPSHPSLDTEEDEPEKMPEEGDKPSLSHEGAPAPSPQSGGMDKSSHSVELDVTSTHIESSMSAASAHERDPLLDMDESDEEDSDKEDEKMMMPTPPATESKRSLVGSRQTSRRSNDLGSSSHSSKGRISRHSQRGTGRGSTHSKEEETQDPPEPDPPLLDVGGDSDDEEDDDVMMMEAPVVDASAAETLEPQQKKRSAFFNDSSDEDSSSDDEDNKAITRASAPLDSPAAAVMGASSTADTEEAEEDADEKEVELFAAALEQEGPDDEDDDEEDDKAKPLKATQSQASEEADEVSDLPERRLKNKLAGGRRKAESSQNSEEASVDPSVDSRTSTGSAGNGSASGSSHRRPRNRKADTGDTSPRKSTSANRGRSSRASNDDRRRKPATKSRRSGGVDRSQSGSSTEDGPESRGGRRRSMTKDINTEDNASKASQESGGESVPSAAPTAQEPAPAATSDAFGSGNWGGFGAFGNTEETAGSSALPTASEHSGFSSNDKVSEKGGGDPFASGGATDAFGGGAFGSGGDADTFGADAFGSGGGFPSSGGGDTAFPASGDGFSGAFMADFGDTTAFPATPAANERKADAFGVGGGGGGFNDAFGNFDAANAFGTSGPDAFDQVNFSAPPVKEEIVYETSPLSGVPVRSQPVPAVYQKTVLKGPFQGSLATNALNGNLIICSETGDGIVLREIDPMRHYLQVIAAPVVSPELQRKVTAKFNLTAHSVESVIRISSGLHYEQGQTKLRVGAILDLKVLEVPQPLRLVAVWMWGQGGTHPVSLQYALSPPSGGDFTYDEGSLVMADNLIFLAGTSPKGPCVFVSKPAVRESWTANSLPGSGNVSAMEATPHFDRDQPYLAVALTDRSVSIWTYREAVEGVSSKGKESGPKRWLFPLCRLESTKTLSGIDATSLNPSGTSTGPGKRDLETEPSSCLQHCILTDEILTLQTQRLVVTVRTSPGSPSGIPCRA